MKNNKQRKRLLLSLVLAVAMIVQLLPVTAFAAETGDEPQQTATVSFTAQAGGAFLCAPQQNVTVSSDLAESYGYTDQVTDGVSALDVLVKAHELVFGESFTKDEAANLLKLSEQGWIVAVFGEETSAFGYWVNRESPWVTIDQTAVKNGDSLDFYLYQDQTDWSDRYVAFYENETLLDALTLSEEEEVTLTLKGYGWDTKPVENASLVSVNMETGELTQLEGVERTNSSGEVSLKFTDAGKYVISARVGDGEGSPVVLVLLPVTVTAKTESITVSLSVLGDDAHGASEEEHTMKGGNLSAWIESETYTVDADATVWDVLQAAFAKHEMTCENASGNYIESISYNGQTLGSGTNGDNSAWLFQLNGAYGMYGVAEQTLRDGDVIVLHYTDNFWVEFGGNEDNGDDDDPGLGDADAAAADVYQTTGAYLVGNMADPTVAAIGGDWAVFGLARAGYPVSAEFYETYYRNAAELLQQNNGVLDSRKYTEYSRVILGLTAAGYDVTDVAGYNLLEPLADYDKVVVQGINGAIFALLALDSHDYEIPAAPAGAQQTTREKLVGYILAGQLADGGFALSGEEADPDVTAMALTALAPYVQTDANVKAAAEKAIAALSAMQTEEGGYASRGITNSESCAQVVVALTALGIDPHTDERFVKNGVSVLDALCSFYVDGGGFRHTADGRLDGMATEQGYYALAAYYRFKAGQTGLYDMSDVQIGKNPVLPENPSVENPAVPGTGDSDAWNRYAALMLLAAAGLIVLAAESHRRFAGKD